MVCKEDQLSQPTFSRLPKHCNLRHWWSDVQCILCTPTVPLYLTLWLAILIPELKNSTHLRRCLHLRVQLSDTIGLLCWSLCPRSIEPSIPEVFQGLEASIALQRPVLVLSGVSVVSHRATDSSVKRKAATDASGATWAPKSAAFQQHVLQSVERCETAIQVSKLEHQHMIQMRYSSVYTRVQWVLICKDISGHGSW